MTTDLYLRLVRVFLSFFHFSLLKQRRDVYLFIFPLLLIKPARMALLNGSVYFDISINRGLIKSSLFDITAVQFSWSADNVKDL